MAIYHSTTKIIGRSSGRSAVASAAYRSRDKLRDQRQGMDFDYSKKRDLAHSEILAPENAPAWATDREALWNEVEAQEKRKDSQLAREVEIALPKELSREQQIELVREYAQENFVRQGMVADINLHASEINPHAHIMLTMRAVTPEGFGKKERAWNQKENILGWREAWASLQNLHLSKAGFDIQVDHRSYADRGVDLEPQIKLGAAHHVAPEKGLELDRVQEVQRIAQENGARIIRNPGIALEQLSYHQAVFTHRDIARFAHTHSADAAQFDQVRSAIEASHEIVRLGKGADDVSRYTTQAMVEAEQNMLADARSMAGQRTHAVKKRYIDQAARVRTLTPEQSQAYRHVMKSGDIAAVVGHAGTGKSYLLGTVREAFEAQGYRVKGAALSGIAAEGLQQSSGIESKTIHRQLWEWDQGRARLTERDVLVIDEAGMVGTRQMHRILDQAQAAGSKVILVGDAAQLQPIEAGGAFRGIIERIGHAELKEIRRQKSPWQREATQELSGDRGQIETALKRYFEQGHIEAQPAFDAAKNRLIEDWSRDQTAIRTGGAAQTSVILSYRNQDVFDLNQKAREFLKTSGYLGASAQAVETTRGAREFARGDRVMFLRNEASLQVKNGTLGTVEGIDRGVMAVRLDSGLRVAVDTRHYQDFDHGYAATIHKTQGVTVDRSYVLASGHFDKHTAYVALSRHREAVTMYVSRDELGFKSFDHLADVMSRERPKGLVMDYASPRGIEVDTWKSHFLSRKGMGREGLKTAFERAVNRHQAREAFLKNAYERGVERHLKQRFIQYAREKGVEVEFAKETDFTMDHPLKGQFRGNHEVCGQNYVMISPRRGEGVMVPTRKRQHFPIGQAAQFDGHKLREPMQKGIGKSKGFEKEIGGLSR